MNVYIFRGISYKSTSYIECETNFYKFNCTGNEIKLKDCSYEQIKPRTSEIITITCSKYFDLFIVEHTCFPQHLQSNYFSSNINTDTLG